MEKLKSIIHRPPLERVDICEKHGEYTAKCHLNNLWFGCPTCSAEKAAAADVKLAEAKAREDRERWEAKIGRSGIPERFHDRSVANYEATTPEQKFAKAFAIEYGKGIKDAMKNGKGAIFIGKPGTGKTHLACAIGLHAMREHNASVLFVTVMRAMRSIKDTWAKGSEISESEAIENLVHPNLLILDEVGVQFGSEFERNTLFDVLNERYEKRRPTIFLSNLTDTEIIGFLGERVIDRLREDGGQIVPFTWDSYRGKVQP